MKPIISVFGVLVFATALTSCHYPTGTGASGTVRVAATDAPFPYSNVSSAVITVSEIDLKNNSTGGYTRLNLPPKSIDFVQSALRNGKWEQLSEIDLTVPAGEYGEVRLVISGASVTLSNGQTFSSAAGTLALPSAATSGLKVKLKDGAKDALKVGSGGSADLMLDFDLSKTFEADYDTDGTTIKDFKFHPVLRASPVTTTGSIQGTILSDNGTPTVTTDDVPLVGAYVELWQNGLEVADAVTQAGGYYAIVALPPGVYDLTVTAPNYQGVLLNGAVTVQVADLGTAPTVTLTQAVAGQ